MTTLTQTRIAVIGAGPVGLALALHAARCLPHAHITVFDARPAEAPVARDPRTLALSLGSVQLLQRLSAWPGEAAQPITTVHVSQTTPALLAPLGPAEVRITAAEQGQPLLGAVLSYGSLVARLQAEWLALAAAEPARLHTRLGTPVTALKTVGGAVEVDAGIVDGFDIAVVAEGGVFAEQARKALTHDYGQTAWVGTATLADGTPGMAFERFTPQGPAALLPLLPGPAGEQRAALVWCVDSRDDPVRELDETQRLAVLASVFPAEAGRLLGLSALKSFALGLNAERTLIDGAGRVVRIGNAAQTLHPVAGQGLNLGLRDAYALVAALRFAGHAEQALKRVEWARAPDRWATIATTDFLARSFTWQAPGVATLRGLGLAALQAAPPLKTWLARRLMFGSR
jgi:2-octaprenyl-6-methoxyphenol hydroxylase